jgi:hypothetical protein
MGPHWPRTADLLIDMRTSTGHHPETEAVKQLLDRLEQLVGYPSHHGSGDRLASSSEGQSTR